MASEKHFNQGVVFGKVVDEIERKRSSGGLEFISFTMNVGGARCGGAKAYCRMWGADRFEPFLAALKANTQAKFFLRGFFGQYWNERNEVFSNFTIFEWSERDSNPRAAFILKGYVTQAQKVNSGQRLLMDVVREGQQTEKFELWVPAEELLDEVQSGQTVEVKGYVRNEVTEDDFGGSSGPVRAYVKELRVVS